MHTYIYKDTPAFAQLQHLLCHKLELLKDGSMMENFKWHVWGVFLYFPESLQNGDAERERQNTSLITGLHDRFSTFRQQKENPNNNSLQFIAPMADKVFLHLIVQNYTVCISIPTDLGASEIFCGADVSNSCRGLWSDVVEHYERSEKTEWRHPATLQFAVQMLSQPQKKEATGKAHPYLF